LGPNNNDYRKFDRFVVPIPAGAHNSGDVFPCVASLVTQNKEIASSIDSNEFTLV
jgi:hypothetical protein